MAIIDTDDASWGMRDVIPTWVKEQDTYNEAIISACGKRVQVAPGEVQECDDIMANNSLVGDPVKGWAKMGNLRFPVLAVEGDTAWRLDPSREMYDVSKPKKPSWY